MEKKYKEFLTLSVLDRQDKEEKMIVATSTNWKSSKKVAKMIYLPDEVFAFIQKNSSGSFSSCAFSLIEFALQMLEKDRKRIISS